MRRILHVTNGDGVGVLLGQSGLPGDVLPWRDVLHDGPVPGGLGVSELAAVRALFLAHPGFGGFYPVHRSFTERDLQLAAASEFDRILLWFEHDLYDQLQLLQVLDRLASGPCAGPSVELICIDRYPGIEPFYGLGQLTSAQLAGLYHDRVSVTAEHYALGVSAWAAFTAPDPLELERLAKMNFAALPFLSLALQRFICEYPSVANGLSQTENTILELVAAGESRPGRLFSAWQLREQAPFLGDWGFWQRIEGLADGRVPLLDAGPESVFRRPRQPRADAEFLHQPLRLTDSVRLATSDSSCWR